MSSAYTFKNQYNFAERKAKSTKLRTDHSDRVPVICQKLAGADLPQLAEERLLLPCNFTVGNLTTFIRSHIKISPEKSIFLFVNNTLLPAHQELLTVYKERHDLDGFLYILYSGENSFGQRDESTIG